MDSFPNSTDCANKHFAVAYSAYLFAYYNILYSNLENGHLTQSVEFGKEQVRHLAFSIQPSAFSLQSSVFSLQSSVFSLQTKHLSSYEYLSISLSFSVRFPNRSLHSIRHISIQPLPGISIYHIYLFYKFCFLSVSLSPFLSSLNRYIAMYTQYQSRYD